MTTAEYIDPRSINTLHTDEGKPVELMFYRCGDHVTDEQYLILDSYSTFALKHQHVTAASAPEEIIEMYLDAQRVQRMEKYFLDNDNLINKSPAMFIKPDMHADEINTFSRNHRRLKGWHDRFQSRTYSLPTLNMPEGYETSIDLQGLLHDVKQGFHNLGMLKYLLTKTNDIQGMLESKDLGGRVQDICQQIALVHEIIRNPSALKIRLAPYKVDAITAKFKSKLSQVLDQSRYQIDLSYAVTFAEKYPDISVMANLRVFEGLFKNMLKNADDNYVDLESHDALTIDAPRILIFKIMFIEFDNSEGGQVTRKIYDTFDELSDQGKKNPYVCFVLEDRNPYGFTEQLLQTGYQRGFSSKIGKGGQGVGMADYVKRLRSMGMYMLLENVTHKLTPLSEPTVIGSRQLVIADFYTR